MKLLGPFRTSTSIVSSEYKPLIIFTFRKYDWLFQTQLERCENLSHLCACCIFHEVLQQAQLLSEEYYISEARRWKDMNISGASFHTRSET
jgi:hypothetical protein